MSLLVVACDDPTTDIVETIDTDDPTMIRWLDAPQRWTRDTDRPVLNLGSPGAFDATHLFAPYVASDGESFRLWYSGASETVDARKYSIGLATSPDGLSFERTHSDPVLELPEDDSALTISVLTDQGGAIVEDRGRVRAWITSADLRGGGTWSLHALTASDPDGTWDEVSPPLLDDVYAPSVILDGDTYRMWFTDASDPGLVNAAIFHAQSDDGIVWTVDPEPAIEIDQGWESQKVLYPRVIRHAGLYMMWYGSNWADHGPRTAIGFAVSEDGRTWHKSPRNPVLTPDPDRAWESHYTTSHSVVVLPDGRLRIWYASRTKPPFFHKYFAISTAVWDDAPGPTRPLRKQSP